MQKSFPLLTLLCLLAMANLQARSPEQFNYQAAVRDVSGNSLAAGVHVSVWFEIHDGPAPGTVVFTETTTAITNRFGLINRPVGSLTDLPAVNRASGGKYLQVETDPPVPRLQPAQQAQRGLQGYRAGWNQWHVRNRRHRTENI